jgi:DNA-binding SARP family transcriptional activator
VLSNGLPQVPVFPWAAVQPTGEDLIRTWGLVAAWLLLASASATAGWLALRRVRGERTRDSPDHSVSRRVTLPGLPGPLSALAGDRELLSLFATPRVRSEVAMSAPNSNRGWEGLDDGGGVGMPDPCPRVRLFGPLVVEGSRGEGGLSERATRGLIAFLALRRAPVSLDELSEALWPDESPAKTRPRLWKAKRQAQQLLGVALLRRGDAYELDRKRIRFDADELPAGESEELGAVELEEALRLVEGEPLADVDYSWADGERRRLQAIRMDLFAQGAATRLHAMDGRGALAIAERLIESDSLNEQAWRTAMEAEALLGQRQAVLDRFERLRRELDKRLGLRPQTATVETYHRLLGQA